MNDVIDRLRRNARKQKEYRCIVRGGVYRGKPYGDVKRTADAFFLRNYAGLTLRAVGAICGLSSERVRQIAKTVPRFVICHPKKSCMLGSIN